MKNITHKPTQVELGNMVVKRLKISSDGKSIFAMEMDKRDAVLDQGDDSLDDS